MIIHPKQTAPVAPPDLPMRPGTGLLLGRNPLGTWFSTMGGSGDFSHPFTVTVSGQYAFVSLGYVIADVAAEPKIGRVPISGTDNAPPPKLKLDPTRTNALGESWICVEVTPNKSGKLAAAEDAGEAAKVEIVQCDAPFVMAGETGRAPLALLRYDPKDKTAPPELHQIAFFHFRYETTQPAEGKRRHFFL